MGSFIRIMSFAFVAIVTASCIIASVAGSSPDSTSTGKQKVFNFLENFNDSFAIGDGFIRGEEYTFQVNYRSLNLTWNSTSTFPQSGWCGGLEPQECCHLCIITGFTNCGCDQISCACTLSWTDN